MDNEHMTLNEATLELVISVCFEIAFFLGLWLIVEGLTH